MENDIFDNEFEHFLKESVDQYRMYPSDSVWNSIYSNLHFGSRLLGFGFTFLMLTLGTLSIFLLNGNKIEQVNSSTIISELFMPDDIALDVRNSQSTIAKNNPGFKNHIAPEQKGINEVIAAASVKEALYNDVIENSFTASSGTDESEELERFENSENEATGEITNTINESLNTTPVMADIKDQSLAMPEALEHALTNLNLRPGKNKTSLQVYFTPNITTRRLSENKSYILNGATSLQSLSSASMNHFNVNDFVNHNPDIGIEVGMAAIIPISNNLNLRAGLQFNVSRYAIKAYNMPGTVATYALNRGNRIDSVSMMSNYRNITGYNPDKLHNYYFQVSAPVGVEYIFAKNDKAKFGIAGTIQPTYLLKDRVYLLSVDYKNYTEVPWLVRRVNANTSIETFVSYSTGKVKWQIGPQVRYQLLSSYVDTYPVKENLLNFGFKVGATLNK